MNTVLLVLTLGTPQFFMKFPTEADCLRKINDYTAMSTKKKPNMFEVKCVPANSPELVGVREINEELK